MLERHASLLTDEYKKHFAASSPNHRKPGEATGELAPHERERGKLGVINPPS